MQVRWQPLSDRTTPRLGDAGLSTASSFLRESTLRRPSFHALHGTNRRSLVRIDNRKFWCRSTARRLRSSSASIPTVCLVGFLPLRRELRLRHRQWCEGGVLHSRGG